MENGPVASFYAYPRGQARPSAAEPVFVFIALVLSSSTSFSRLSAPDSQTHIARYRRLDTDLKARAIN